MELKLFALQEELVIFTDVESKFWEAFPEVWLLSENRSNSLDEVPLVSGDLTSSVLGQTVCGHTLPFSTSLFGSGQRSRQVGNVTGMQQERLYCHEHWFYWNLFFF